MTSCDQIKIEECVIFSSLLKFGESWGILVPSIVPVVIHQFVKTKVAPWLSATS